MLKSLLAAAIFWLASCSRPMIDSCSPPSIDCDTFPWWITWACGDGSTFNYWIGGASAGTFFLCLFGAELACMAVYPFISSSCFLILKSSFSSCSLCLSFSASFSRFFSSICILNSSRCYSNLRYFSLSIACGSAQAGPEAFCFWTTCWAGSGWARYA